MLTYQAFDQMLKRYNIPAKDLSALSGVSSSRISQFRSGKGSDITTKSLDSLLKAAEEISPGSAAFFASLLSPVPTEGVNWCSLISGASPADIKEILSALSIRWGQMLSKNSEENPPFVLR